MYTVMIVDDEYPARNMLDYLLDWDKTDFRIIAKAENGKQALNIYHEQKPDLVITDILMPVMDGIQFIKEIRKENPDQCIVVLSCHESFSYAQQVIQLGVKDYLIKDVLTGEQLQTCLNRIKENINRAPKVSTDTETVILKRDPDETLLQVYPAWLVKAENRLNLLQNHLMTKNYADAQNCIKKLYQVPFDGLARYHFLEWINSLTYDLLCEQCKKNGISQKLIFGEFEGKEKELLLSTDNPEKNCMLLCEFIQNLALQDMNQKKYNHRILHIIQYLHENYYHDISLQSVADHFGIHKVYLARSFKSETGSTLNEYLNQLRIEKAKLRL